MERIGTWSWRFVGICAALVILALGASRLRVVLVAAFLGLVLTAVHRVFSQAQRMIEGTYQGAGSSEHLQEYLDEYVFRFNRRSSRHRGLLFLRLLQRAVATPPVIYKDLIRLPTPKPSPPTGVPGPHRKPGSLNTTPTHQPWRDAPTPW